MEAGSDAEGLRLHCEIVGQGDLLLLLHGFTGAGADWQHVFTEPLVGWRTIIPDLRGHGRTPNPSNAFTHRQSAADVLGLLDRLNLPSIKAIGMSAGAKTLLHMAIQQPGRIEAMVLVSATPAFPAEARALMAKFSTGSLSDDEWRAMRQRHVQGDRQIQALLEQGRAFAESYDDMNLTREDLGRISARTLIVHGDRDPFYPVQMAVDLYNGIPHSTLWVIPGGAHVPIFGELRAPFVATALEFLKA
ncbi:MAG: alpha/beta fold hydrolase [Vicinamibacterales bacterium]